MGEEGGREGRHCFLPAPKSRHMPCKNTSTAWERCQEAQESTTEQRKHQKACNAKKTRTHEIKAMRFGLRMKSSSMAYSKVETEGKVASKSVPSLTVGKS